jgi:hypothetical protein
MKFSQVVSKLLRLNNYYETQVELKVNGRTMGVFVINSEGRNEQVSEENAKAFVNKTFAVETKILRKLSSKEVETAKRKTQMVALPA